MSEIYWNFQSNSGHMLRMRLISLEFAVRAVSEFIGGSDRLPIMSWTKTKYTERLKLKSCDDNDGVLYLMWLHWLEINCDLYCTFPRSHDLKTLESAKFEWCILSKNVLRCPFCIKNCNFVPLWYLVVTSRHKGPIAFFGAVSSFEMQTIL